MAISVTVGDSRREQWACFGFLMDLWGLLSGVVALVSSGVASWGFRYKRHISGSLFRCRAVVSGCGCMTASHMDDSHMSGETSGCCSVVVRVCSHTEEIWSCQSVGAIGVAVALVYLYTTGSHVPGETPCDSAVWLCLHKTGWDRIGYGAVGARARLRTSEEILKCYVAAAVAAAPGFEPKAHDWPGAAQGADIWHSPELFPDAEVVLSHSAHRTMLARSVVFPLEDAASAHLRPLEEVLIDPVGAMMGAFRVVFP